MIQKINFMKEMDTIGATASITIKGINNSKTDFTGTYVTLELIPHIA